MTAFVSLVAAIPIRRSTERVFALVRMARWSARRSVGLPASDYGR